MYHCINKQCPKKFNTPTERSSHRCFWSNSNLRCLKLRRAVNGGKFDYLDLAIRESDPSVEKFTFASSCTQVAASCRDLAELLSDLAAQATSISSKLSTYGFSEAALNLNGKGLSRILKTHTSLHNGEYNILEIEGDGRCLFRALLRSAGLTSNRDSSYYQTEAADRFRSRIVDEHLRRRGQRRWFFERRFQEYITAMRMPSTWGGEPEIVMASHVLQSPIDVYMFECGKLRRKLVYGDNYTRRNEKRISILFNGVHYDAIEFKHDSGMDEVDASSKGYPINQVPCLSTYLKKNKEPLHVFVACSVGSIDSEIVNWISQNFVYGLGNPFILHLHDFPTAFASLPLLGGFVEFVGFIESCTRLSIAVLFCARLGDMLLDNKELVSLAIALEDFASQNQENLVAARLYKVFVLGERCEVSNSNRDKYQRHGIADTLKWTWKFLFG